MYCEFSNLYSILSSSSTLHGKKSSPSTAQQALIFECVIYRVEISNFQYCTLFIEYCTKCSILHTKIGPGLFFSNECTLKFSFCIVFMFGGDDIIHEVRIFWVINPVNFPRCFYSVEHQIFTILIKINQS